MRRLSRSVLLAFIFQTSFLSADPGELTSRIAGNLVCLCGCGNMIVRNCECGNAAKMTEEVRELLVSGKTEQEVYAAFVAQYGESVLAAPLAQGFNLLAWGLPLLALASGAGIVVVVIRRLTASTSPHAEGAKVETPEISEKYRELLARELSD